MLRGIDKRDDEQTPRDIRENGSYEGQLQWLMEQTGLTHEEVEGIYDDHFPDGAMRLT